MNDANEKLTMSIDETAARLGIGRSTCFEAARRNEIPTLRVGRRILVPIAALEKMLGSSGDRK